MRLKNSDAFDIRSLGSDATNLHEASMLEDRDELGSVGGDSVEGAGCGGTKGQSELSPGGSYSGGTTSGSSPGDVLPKHCQPPANQNGSPPSATSAVASVQAALAALQAGQMSLNQVKKR